MVQMFVWPMLNFVSLFPARFFYLFNNFVCVCGMALCSFCARYNRELTAQFYRLQGKQESKVSFPLPVWRTHVSKIHSLKH
jgi:hypothetical protein